MIFWFLKQPAIWNSVASKGENSCIILVDFINFIWLALCFFLVVFRHIFKQKNGLANCPMVIFISPHFGQIYTGESAAFCIVQSKIMIKFGNFI
jgi:hypothetical protein